MDIQDYDGDETMFSIPVDNYMAKLFYPFSPFFNLLLLDQPLKISRNPAWTEPIVASTSNWMEVGQRRVKAFLEMHAHAS